MFKKYMEIKKYPISWKLTELFQLWTKKEKNNKISQCLKANHQ